MSIQKVTEFWDRRPCNIRHGTTPIEENALAYSWEVTERKLRVEPHIRWHLNPVKWRGKKVLDMGCGIGTQSLLLARAGAQVHAIDVSERSLDIARQRRMAEELDYEIDFWRKDMMDPNSCPKRYYDMVYAFGTIHHVPSPRSAFQNAWEWLKPGGEFRFMVYNRYSWKAFWILAKYGKFQFWKWEDLIQEYSEAQSGCPITHTYTPAHIRGIMRSVGFEIARLEVDHIFPYRIQDYIEHRYIKEWYWRLLPTPVFRWLEHRLGWHLLVEARKPL